MNSESSPTVLVIDSDPVSRRFAEIALARKQDLQVTATPDAESALAVLRTKSVHLILAETDFADMNGLQLFRRLIQEKRLCSVPFVFLSADAQVTTRRAAFAAGVDDFLVKPCDADLLATRVRALISRERRAIAARQARTYALAGRFAALSFQDLTTILGLGGKSGTISIATRDALGTVYLDGGLVVHAVLGNLAGAAAFTHLAAQDDGQFEFTPGPCPLVGGQRNLADAARSSKTRTVTATYFAVRERPSEEQGFAAGPAPERPLIPASVPESGAAHQIEHGIQDGFTLGDLMTFSAEDLRRWTEATPARDRFHVLLFADLAQGVSSLLTLAGAPTEDWILRSLSPKAKVAGLSFFLRHERLVDVVLLDIRDPTQLRESLRRVPSAVIVAPPEGDPTGLGIKERMDLADLLSDVSPPAVLVLGDPTLQKVLRASMVGAGAGGLMRFLPAPLGGAGTDLRTVLGEAIRLCASSRQVS